VVFYFISEDELMAKVPLRAYIKEIESIIGQKQTEEAIAHCRHILQTYPKHIDTYRMLGKAYLESQRYGNAADIFQRVLSAVPDDFVSHVGMSIIREDENNLDAAIWHMERAFEGQPYNAAIQGELRRLFGRRDGMEPPKVHLTRGALARMYAKGNLYPQAIAELRAAIAEDPQRFDLRVLLAQMYSQSDDQAKAIETCGSILSKLPYCLVANQILADLLEKTERAKEAEAYKKQVIELDPYEAYIGPNAPSVSDVPTQAVSVEQLIWDGGPAIAASDQPEWAISAGIDFGDSGQTDEGLPDWISETGEYEDTLQSGSDSDDVSEEEQIPDWMKEAGWGPSSGEFDESKSAFALDEAEEQVDDVTDAVAGEIPDWLQQIAPPGAIEDPAEIAESELDFSGPSTAEGEIPDWLQDATQEKEDTPDWLAPAAIGAAGAVAGLALSDDSDESDSDGLEELGGSDDGEEIPDWLAGIEKEEESIRTLEDELPDWLSEIAEDEEAEPEDEGADLLSLALPLQAQPPLAHMMRKLRKPKKLKSPIGCKK